MWQGKQIRISMKKPDPRVFNRIWMQVVDVKRKRFALSSMRMKRRKMEKSAAYSYAAVASAGLGHQSAYYGRRYDVDDDADDCSGEHGGGPYGRPCPRFSTEYLANRVYRACQ